MCRQIDVFLQKNIENANRTQHSDGHADGYVQEEMLAQIDARIASERGENQTNQTHFLLAGRFGLFGVEESQRGEKREERGGVSRREGVPTVQFHGLNEALLPRIVQSRVSARQILEDQFGPRQVPKILHHVRDDGRETLRCAKHCRPNGPAKE